MNAITFFLILFGGKILFVDISLIVVSILLIIKRKLVFTLSSFEKKVLFILVFLSAYALLISIIYGGIEIYWPLKFIKASFLWVLLSVLIKNSEIDSLKLNNLVIWAAFIHSAIILMTILIPSFRDAVYSITGYQHRSVLGLRSPGITISFNSTAIVHVIGLYLIIYKEHRFKGIGKLLVFLCIFSSLFFLGRTMSFLGLGILFLSGVIKRKKTIIMLGAFLLVFIPTTFEFIIDDKNIDNYSPTVAILLKNYQKFVSPFILRESDVNILTYQEETLGSHYYFSDSPLTLIFGNSRSGHTGITDFDRRGETDSDLGFINSVNANGAIVTLLLYLFYFYVFKQSRHNEVVLVICALTCMLTFKETGFFTSHATPLLFAYLFVLRKKLI